MEFLFQNLFLYFSTWFGFGFGFDLGLGFTETFWFGFGFCQNRKSGFVRSLESSECPFPSKMKSSFGQFLVGRRHHTPEKKVARHWIFQKEKKNFFTFQYNIQTENCELRDPLNFFSEVKDRIFFDHWFNYSEA